MDKFSYSFQHVGLQWCTMQVAQVLNSEHQCYNSCTYEVIVLVTKIFLSAYIIIFTNLNRMPACFSLAIRETQTENKGPKAHFSTEALFCTLVRV